MTAMRERGSLVLDVELVTNVEACLCGQGEPWLQAQVNKYLELRFRKGTEPHHAAECEAKGVGALTRTQKANARRRKKKRQQRTFSASESVQQPANEQQPTSISTEFSASESVQQPANEQQV